MKRVIIQMIKRLAMILIVLMIIISMAGCASAPLIDAAIRGDNIRLNALLTQGENPNQRDSFYGRTPLMIAAIEGHADVARTLLIKGADPNARLARSMVVKIGSRDGISRFPWGIYPAEGDPSKWGGRVLKGPYSIIYFKGVDSWGQLRVRGEGVTPLMAAAVYGHSDVVKALLEHGANVDLTDGDGKTALEWATIIGNTDIVSLLQERREVR